MRAGAEAGNRLHDPSWDARIGSIWARALSANGVRRTGIIAEIGPGFTLKIGLGLREFGFRGCLFVVEPGRRCLDWIVPRYRSLLPGVEIIPIASPLSAAAGRLPAGLDALLMNHVLDDLVLSAASAPLQSAAIFSRMHRGAGCHPGFLRVWRGLRAHPERLERAVHSVIGDICHLCFRVQPRLLGASQYQSWFQMHHGLHFVDSLSAPLLGRLRSRLRASGIPSSSRLPGRGSSPSRWLFAAWAGGGTP